MEKYKPLLNRRITVEYNGKHINAYKITEITPTDEIMEGRGKIYLCEIEWHMKDLPGAYPKLGFDTQTLDELVEGAQANCPGIPGLIYRMPK